MSFGTESLAQLTTIFNRRFVLNALLPTLVFVTATGFVMVAGSVTMAGLARWWSGLDTLTRLVAVLGYVAAIWFVSTAVASQWRAIVRLFEGYPFVRVMKSRTPGLAWHARARKQLWSGDEPNHDKAYTRYPGTPNSAFDAPEVLPTRLGNILRAAERYPLERYGADAVYFWPRLFPMLPQEFQRQYEEFMLDHEFPLVVSFQSMIAALVGGMFLLVSGATPLFFVLWLGGLVLTSYLFYEMALAAAEEVGEQQRVAFDLYRGQLLDRWATPADVKDELAAFSAIADFIVANDPPMWGRPQSSHRRRKKPNSA